MRTRNEAPAPRLLVVDDEDTIRELLCGSLRFAGYEVTSAGSGAEALRASLSARPDLVLLDVMMPDGDGFEVARRIRSAGGPEVPVIFLTARDDHVWEYNPSGEGSVVEPCISYLRRKADQGEPRLIHTIRGVGYVLRIPPP
jgi:two-component system OmpR family response regulator